MIKQVRICQTILRQNPHLQYQVKSLTPLISEACFATATKGYYEKCQARYQEHVKAFREKVEKLEAENKKAAPKPFPKGYTHPFNTDHHPINYSPVKLAELFHDFIGPEQVSPHYENFLVSRKYLMTLIGGLFVLSLGIGTLDVHWIAKSSFLPFMFWMLLQYFYLELRKSLLKPFLMRWYRRVSANEIYNFEVFYHENIELKMRDMIRVAKHQLEFWQLHREFLDIKAESINTFLANEYANLQRHISERALNVLKQAQTFEEMNRTKVLQGIVDEASKEIDRQLQGPQRSEILKQMLDSAILGLSKGYMDYENDPIMPIVQNYIKTNASKYSDLPLEEQRKLVSLTEAQIQSLRDYDRKAKREFLETEPRGLDSALKSHEQARKILSSWGK